MPLKVMELVDQRLAVLSEPGWSGRSVREVCARHGISPDTFYAWKRRYEAEGLAGLAPRDRRPHHSPNQLAVEVEDRILWLRKEHGWGPRKIRDALRMELAETGMKAPAVSTVQQALARRGVLTPRRRRPYPAAPPRRFAWAASNQLWQIDGALHHLAGGRPYWVVDLIDDHSRFCLATLLGGGLTGHLAWNAVRAAVADYGLPEALLSDNGLCFTGRLHDMEVFFERQTHRAGIHLYHSRPYHPQTCGKIERLHATLRGYLTRHDPPRNYQQARTQLAAFRQHYNQQRPHQALNGATPASVYQPGTGLLLPTLDLPPHRPPPTRLPTPQNQPQRPIQLRQPNLPPQPTLGRPHHRSPPQRRPTRPLLRPHPDRNHPRGQHPAHPNPITASDMSPVPNLRHVPGQNRRSTSE